MTAHVVRVGGIWLDGDQLADVATCVELVVSSKRRNPDGVSVAPRLLALLDSLREARGLSCAAQLTQLRSAPEPPESMPTDLMTVSEVAKLMGCSESNVRSRARRGSLWAMKNGREWLFSHADVIERTGEAS